MTKDDIRNEYMNKEECFEKLDPEKYIQYLENKIISDQNKEKVIGRLIISCEYDPTLSIDFVLDHFNENKEEGAERLRVNIIDSNVIMESFK